MDRRTAIATIGAVTVSSLTGCLGESGEIEHIGTSDPIYGNVAMRRINFQVEIPPESRASIEINLTRTAKEGLSIEQVSGSGSLLLFSEYEYERFQDDESADGYAITTDGSGEHKGGFTIDDTQQVLVASNFGRDGTNTEETFTGEATITERLPPTQQFNYPAVD